MKIVKGNKTEEINKKSFKNLIRTSQEIVIDLGTGDGRFVYAYARENPNSFVIGIDPNQKQMSIFSKKVNKERLENTLFAVGSIEKIPERLKEIADKVYVNFPWGSLLGGIATSKSSIIKNISSLLKPKGILEIIFGYSQEAESSEVKRLGLNNLDLQKIETEIIPIFEKNNLKSIQTSILKKSDIFEIDSSWGKKLSFGNTREMFHLTFSKTK